MVEIAFHISWIAYCLKSSQVRLEKLGAKR